MINVLYAGNSGVFDGVLSSLLSILMRSNTAEPLTVYIFTMDITRMDEKYTPITDKHAEFLDRLVKEKNPESRVILKDVGELYLEHLAFSKNEDCYCSPYTLLRLLCDLVPDMPDKLLYLDCDLLFNRDISLLWDTDVSEYEYAAARDHYGKFLVNPNYINAGVILFNLGLCKRHGLFERARELIRTKKLMFADQSAIIRSTTRKKVISQRFNDQKFLYPKTVIRHFSKRLFYLPYPHTENIKQWNTERVRKKFGYKCFDGILDEYLKLKEIFDNEQN